MARSFFDDEDRASSLACLRRLVADAPARWGRMSAPRRVGLKRGAAWGRFCHEHFDHHLRQFGA